MTLRNRLSAWLASLRRKPLWTLAIYGAGLLAVWLLIRFGSDRWWVSTIMMFGPKWVYALPLPIFVIWLAIVRASWRVWGLAAVCGCLLIFPIAGFRIPWRTIAGGQSTEICLLTCNTHGDAKQLAAYIANVDPDVVCMQECTWEHAKIFDDRWQVVRAGPLIVAARGQVERVDQITRDVPGNWPRTVGLLTQVTVRDQTFEVATIHLLSPRYGLSEMTSSTTVIAPWRRQTLLQEIDYRRSESEYVSRWLGKRHGPLLIAGDFNTPVISTIYRDCWGEYRNAFNEAGWGFGHTVAIEEGGIRFTCRIDQILGSDAWRFGECWVGPEVGSDHRPLVARGQLRTGNEE